MKNRHIIFVTIIVVLMTMMYSAAFAETYVEYDANACAEIFSFIEPEFSVSQNDGEVSRGDFVRGLARISDIPVISSKEASFSDVTTDMLIHEEVETAFAMGWISKSEQFYPDRQITLSEAVKIAVSAIGGSELAEHIGGYPYGYYNVAVESDLLEGIAERELSSYLSEDDANILVMNTVLAPTFKKGEEKISTARDGKSLLYSNRGLYLVEGVCMADSLTNMADELSKTNSNVMIGSEVYSATEGFAGFVGYNVVALCKEDSGIRDVLFMARHNNNIISVFGQDIFKKANNVYYIDELKKEKKLKFDDNYIYLVNGKVDVNVDDIEELLNNDIAELEFVDNDDDGYIDIVYAWQYFYTVVDYFDLYEGYIYDRFSVKAFIDLSDDEIKYSAYVLSDGVLYPSTIKEITEDSVLAVASSTDGKYKKIIICTDYVSGDISASNADKKVRINFEEFNVSPYYEKHYTLKVGQKADYYLGLNNDIVFCTSDSKMKYAWFISGTENLDEISDNYRIKLFTQDDEVANFIIAKKVMYDSELLGADEVYRKIKALTGDYERLIKYSVNADGKVDKIDTAEDRVGDILALKDSFPDGDSLILNFKVWDENANGSIDDNMVIATAPQLLSKSGENPQFNFAKTKYFFVIPEEDNRDDEEMYRMAKSTEIAQTGRVEYSLGMYNVDLSGCPETIIFTAGSLSGRSVEGDGSYVVEEVYLGIDKEESPCYAVQVKGPSEYETMYLSDDVAQEYFMPKPGDVINISVDNKNSIKSMELYYDFSNYTINPDRIAVNGWIEYVHGFVYSINDNYMYIVAPTIADNMAVVPNPAEINFSDLKNVNLERANISFVNVVRSQSDGTIKSVSVEPAPVSKIKSIQKGGPTVSFAVVHFGYSTAYDLFIYEIDYI